MSLQLADPVMLLRLLLCGLVLCGAAACPMMLLVLCAGSWLCDGVTAAVVGVLWC
jgi:hypothetical protein